MGTFPAAATNCSACQMQGVDGASRHGVGVVNVAGKSLKQAQPETAVMFRFPIPRPPPARQQCDAA